MIVDHFIDSADGVELVQIIKLRTNFLRAIIIDRKVKAVRKREKYDASLIIATDRSKLMNGRYRAVVY